MGVAQVLWDTFRKAKDYMEAKESGDHPAYDADMEAMIPALKREIPCKIHCTQHDMLTAIEVANAYGVRFSLEHAWGASDYIDEIVESGCDVCYGPIGTYRAAGERRKVDIEAVKTLDERGVNVALITDSPILSEESLYHHIGEAVREGVPYLRALRMGDHQSGARPWSGRPGRNTPGGEGRGPDPGERKAGTRYGCQRV